MDDRLKIGDVVRLRIGGPWMTVEGIPEYDDPVGGYSFASCVWFVESMVQRTEFLPALLERKPHED